MSWRSCSLAFAILGFLTTTCGPPGPIVRVDCGAAFGQVGTGPFTQASTSTTPCTPNPCVGQCVVAAHGDADLRAEAVCQARNVKCHAVLVARDGNPAQACEQVPRVSFTCHCQVADQYKCR